MVFPGKNTHIKAASDVGSTTPVLVYYGKLFSEQLRCALVATPLDTAFPDTPPSQEFYASIQTHVHPVARSHNANYLTHGSTRQ